MVSHKQFLRPIYAKENPLRALGAEAARIEDEEGVLLVRCNVGDPTGPTLVSSNKLMSQYYDSRPKGTGYTDHAGHPVLRAIVAQQITKLNRLPEGTLNENKVFCVAGGTGGLNTALSIFQTGENTPVLVTDPYYPPWGPISARNSLQMTRFELRAQDDYLLNGNIIQQKLERVNFHEPIVLMYHYPHNPTGKTLTPQDAQTVAQTLNGLTAKYPNLYLVQEDLYLATIRSDLGIYTPMQHLSADALERTILVHSPSKEGHGQDRGAIIATPSTEIAVALRGSTAFGSLGMSTGSLIGTANTLVDIANGIDPRTEETRDNHRYVTADYYQERMQAVGQGFLDLEQILGITILDNDIPEGTYYLWPKFDFLKGMRVPDALQDVGSIGHDFRDSFPETIQSGGDIRHIFARAHRIGLLPVMMTPGEFFVDKNDNMRMRLAAVDRDLGKMHEIANTIRGLVETILRYNSNEIQADFKVARRTLAQLKELFPPNRQDEYMVPFPSLG